MSNKALFSELYTFKIYSPHLFAEVYLQMQTTASLEEIKLCI